MKKRLLYSLMAVVIFANGYSQNRMWSKASPEKVAPMAKVDRASMPTEYSVLSLDLDAMKAALQTAPSRDLRTMASNVVLQFPNAQGELEKFRMYEASVMAPELAARYPDIHSYVGKGIDDPTATINVSTSIFGLHAMILSAKGTVYADPYTSDLSKYIVYDKSKLHTDRQLPTCLVDDNPENGISVEGRGADGRLLASDGTFRTYRMAMACTIEYAAFHIAAAGVGGGTTAQKKAAVLAAMNVTMTRLNGIYERDMSLRMILVGNNDSIIFVDTDNFTNNNANTLINESQTVIDGAIGSANYDIGHTVSTGGGGLAQSPSVCIVGKARGITGSPAPVGDPYDIDFVAHEVGHQFGASHTFNGLGGNCTVTTRANGFAVEPGSGTTIMAYAGICDAVDVQPHSDDHFHAVSIGQMVAHVTGAGNCSVNVANGNTAPVANAGANYTIPFGTAFILKGSATDANGDALTYCWEQTNTDISTQPPVATSATGPNFRSFSPTTSPNRYMPNFASVLAGNLIPAWEIVPNVARSMNFALTVRDNRTPNGGQTGRDDMTVTFANTGPFRVTYPNTENESWTQGSSKTITWDVAGTTANGINTANVNILLSTDAGATFGTVLASNVTNNGSYTITVPNVSAPFCRIMIEAAGNIYYAVSKSIAIGYTISNVCTTYSNTTAMPIPDGAGNNIAGPVVTSIINVPANGVISDVNATLVGTHSYYWDLITTLIHPDGTTQARLFNRNCNQTSTGFNVTFNDGSPAIVCAANLTGTFAPNQPLNAFNGKSSNGNWSLAVTDNYNGDTGSITSWSINVCALVAQLGTPEQGLTDFVVYPNPNSGNFNIRFSSNSSNDVKVTVYDMRGRMIYDKGYASNGAFDQNINLDNAQAGVYLLNVSDGERKVTKRIVIE